VLSGATGVTHSADGDMSTGDPGTITVTSLANGITMDQDASYTVGTGTVDLISEGDVTLGTITGAHGPSGTTVTVQVHDGSVIEAGSDSAPEISAEHIVFDVTGAGDIGEYDNTLEIDADVLDASTEGGDMWIEDRADGLAVGLVDAGGSTGGDVSLSSINGSITEFGSDPEADILGDRISLAVTGPITRTIGTAANTLEIDAASLSATTQGGRIWLEDTAGGVGVYLVAAGTNGTVNLKATNGSITEAGGDSAADIVGGTLNIEATGVGSTVGSVAQTIEINGAILNALTAGGNMWMADTAGGIQIGLVDAGGTAGGDIDLTALNGSITESGSDGGAELVGNRITLAVTGPISTIGSSANTLEIDAAELNASTQRGNIWLNDIAGGVQIGSMTAGIGTVNLSATNGSITEAGNDAAPEIVARRVNLIVTGAGTIGTSSADMLDIDAEILNASSVGTNIMINDVDGGVAIGQITTGGTTSGTIWMVAQNGSITDISTDNVPDFVSRNLWLGTTSPYQIGQSSNYIDVKTYNSYANIVPGSGLQWINYIAP